MGGAGSRHPSGPAPRQTADAQLGSRHAAGFQLFSLLLWQHPASRCCCSGGSSRCSSGYRCTSCQSPVWRDALLRESLKAFHGLLRQQWLASLTAPADHDAQLRPACAAARRPRRPGPAAPGDTEPAQRSRGQLADRGWRLHLEGALWLGLLGLLYFFLPAQLVQRWNWEDLLGLSGEWLWLEHLSNLLYALVLVVWEPIYVACGFSLYLNRRTHLEAWDIELAFRRLRQRLLSTVPAVLLAVGLLFWPADNGLGGTRCASRHHPAGTGERTTAQPATDQ